MDFIDVIEDVPVYSDKYTVPDQVIMMDGRQFWSSNAETMETLPQGMFCLVHTSLIDRRKRIADAICELKTRALIPAST